MLLVGVAGPGSGVPVLDAAVPVYPLLILHPPPGEVLGERAKHDHNHQKEQHALQRPDGQSLFEEEAHQLQGPQNQVAPEQGLVQLVPSVASVHEAGKRAANPLEDAHT